MAHSSELRWQEAAQAVASGSAEAIQVLLNAEQVYQELLEAYNYAGGTDQGFADQLFQDQNGNPDPITGTATPAQVAMVADLRAAIQALHQLHDAADNAVTTQDDRFSLLRRMS